MPLKLRSLVPQEMATNMPRKIDKNKRNYTCGFSELRKPWTAPITFVSKFLIIGGSSLVLGRMLSLEIVMRRSHSNDPRGIADFSIARESVSQTVSMKRGPFANQRRLRSTGPFPSTELSQDRSLNGGKTQRLSVAKDRAPPEKPWRMSLRVDTHFTRFRDSAAVELVGSLIPPLQVLKNSGNRTRSLARHVESQRLHKRMGVEAEESRSTPG
jgi:hypothetical protein